MPLYEIEQYEINAQTYRVEAESEAQAIKALFAGQAEPRDGHLEFTEIGRDLGLPIDDYPDLARELASLDVLLGEGVIPSIRSIEKVE